MERSSKDGKNATNTEKRWKFDNKLERDEFFKIENGQNQKRQREDK
jgi:hypothetical protein